MAAKQLRTGDYADVMPDMSDEEFEALKRSIGEDGLKHPIEVAPDGTIVDGHHRHRACRELGIEPETVVVEDPSVEQAIRANLTRRNLASGEKRELVKSYLEEHHDGDRTQAEVAAALGVSEGTVSNACKELNPEDFTREEKRQQVADYLDEHPDASNREVSRDIEADVSHPTIGAWRVDGLLEDGGDTDEDDEPDAVDPADESVLEAVGEPDDEPEAEDDPDPSVSGDATDSVSGPIQDVAGPDDDEKAEAFDNVEQLVGDAEPPAEPEPGIDVDRVRSGVAAAGRALDDALDTLPDEEPSVRPEVARARTELDGVEEVLQTDG